tara:strand:+ start:31 stop:534 length:504 start_codon:yes stop_codon:yes gene_type:complete
MIWEYGNYKFNCQLSRPTEDKFNSWKKDFLNLSDVKNYDVWLVGGFLRDSNTKDIDVLLVGKPNYSKVKKLLINGIKIGVNKYNMFVDMTHWNMKPFEFKDNMKKVNVGKLVAANKIVQDGRVVTDWTDGKMVYPDLWYLEREYPKDKQMNKKYNKPILIQKGFNNG